VTCYKTGKTPHHKQIRNCLHHGQNLDFYVTDQLMIRYSPLVTYPCSFDVEISIQQLNRYRSSRIDHAQAGSSTLRSNIHILINFISRAVIAQSVWYWAATGQTIAVLWFDSQRGLGIFLFTTASRTALGPTQPPIQWVLGSLSLGIKRPGRAADHSRPSSAEVKECVELYLHSPIRLHGMVLS
jgi:hypothetical protein